jgi:hypothetical protein
VRYTALTNSGPFDIGEFPDQDTAEAFALDQYGEDLQAVMIQQNDSVTVTADAPTNWMLPAALAVVALVTLSKPRRKKR